MYYFNKGERTIFKSQRRYTFDTFKEAKAALLEALQEERHERRNAIAVFADYGYTKSEEAEAELAALEADIERIRRSNEEDWIK
jgi:uncharacterized membrane protein